MEYKDRAKNRKLKRKLLQIIDLIKLKGFNLSLYKKITLSWVLVWFISLFLKWVNSENNINHVSNSFWSLAWSTWITILIIQALIIFLIFSRKNKEKLKLSTDIHIKDYSLIIVWWIFTIIISINTLNFINWLQTFASDIFIWAWIISEICAWILITVWWIIARIEYYKNKSQIYINESDEESNTDKENDEDKNMSLPF